MTSENTQHDATGQMAGSDYAKDFGDRWTNWYTDTRTSNGASQLTAQQV